VTTTTQLSTYAGTWTLDPSRTTVTFQTKAMWVLKVKGTFVAAGGGGTISEDGTLQGTLVFDAASIDTGNKKRDDHLRSPEFFGVETHPTITFTASTAAVHGPGQVQVKGQLTISGQTRPVTVLAEVSAAGDTATVRTETDIDRSEWGVTWAKMGAGLANHVVVEARFTKA
jgi:polyisoprenoid-binding protein YceI